MGELFQKRKKKKIPKSGQIWIPEGKWGVRSMDTGASVRRVCAGECVGVFRGGVWVCGLSVYLSGETPHRPQQFQA